jgi:hypothetical protein
VWELVIYLKTTQSLGLTMSATRLFQTDEVIREPGHHPWPRPVSFRAHGRKGCGDAGCAVKGHGQERPMTDVAGKTIDRTGDWRNT